MPRRQLIAGLIILLATIGWAFFIAAPHKANQASFIDPLENQLLNLRMLSFGTVEPPENVVIVAIDNATLSEANPLGTGRGTLAQIIDKIAQAGAQVITLDILLSDKGSPVGDQLLRDALAKSPSVIAAAGTSVSLSDPQGVPTTHNELWPLSIFSDQSSLGMANISTDQMGIPRYVPAVFITSRGLHSSLAVQTAAVFTQSALRLSGETATLGEVEHNLDAGYYMPVRFFGPAGTIKTVSALEILNGPIQTDLSGKAVIIGVTATGLGDRFPTPFDPDFPGVEVMATSVAQLLSDTIPQSNAANRWLDFVAVLILTPLCAMLVWSLPLALGMILSIGITTTWLAVIWFSFSFGIWLNAALPLIGAGPPLLLIVLLKYRQERHNARHSDRAVIALKKFQSPKLADEIARNPDFLQNPEPRHLVTCFADLSGFTQISQDLGSTRSETFLKQFHSLIGTIAQKHNGVILNYMGDGALLAFGIFDGPKGCTDQAFNAAREIVKNTEELGRQNTLERPLGCRIGLHFGQVMLSRLGADQHQQLTISGDSVNIASRLLEIAKTQSASIAATEDFRATLSTDTTAEPFKTETFPIRGRQGNVLISFWRG
ncbi:MAG: adenylate/guanylate cyclase domain-containing protein [Roseobacter sp.]